MIRSVARLLAIELGEYVIVDVIDRVGVLGRMHIEHADPRETPRLRALCDATVLAPNGRIPRLLARGGNELIANVTGPQRKLLGDLAVDRDPVRSYMASTFVVNGEPMGVLTLVTTRAKRRYSQDDADVLIAIADWVGLGLENALAREARPRASVHPPDEAVTGTIRRRSV